MHGHALGHQLELPGLTGNLCIHGHCLG
jgi:hypothetical protein